MECSGDGREDEFGTTFLGIDRGDAQESFGGQENEIQLVLTLTAAAIVSGVPIGLTAQQSQPDNTKSNARDRANSEPTADQGNNNLSDRELMQNIRKALLEDKSLSTYAQNVKIIAQNGKVTLKGPVRSEKEKTTIDKKATEVAGPGNVTNELTVKPVKKTGSS